MSPGSAGPPTAQVRQSLVELVEPLIAAEGYDLEDVAVSRAGRRNLVRVVVDADGGVDLDAVATVSRVVSDALDADLDSASPLAAALAGSYTLEVTSPGVDRPLTEPRHWRRAAGRLVTTEVEGRHVTGRVVAADRRRRRTGRRPGAGSRFPGASLGRGKVQIEFNRGNPDPDGKE